MFSQLHALYSVSQVPTYSGTNKQWITSEQLVERVPEKYEGMN